MSSYATGGLAQIHQKELREEAARHRLGREARRSESRLGDRLLLRVADSMITAGTKLRARHQSVPQLQTKAYL